MRIYNGFLSAYRSPDGIGADYVRDEKDRIVSETDTDTEGFLLFSEKQVEKLMLSS